MASSAVAGESLELFAVSCGSSRSRRFSVAALRSEKELDVGVAGQVRRRTDTLFEPELAAARSCTPSPLKSPTATE